MQRIGLLDGNNITYDHDFSAGLFSIMNGGVISGFTISGSGASAEILPGKAMIECTRSNGEKTLVFFESTTNVAVDMSGTKKVYILVNQAKIDDGSSNAEDGTGIGAITTGASYPASNYVPLYSIVAGVSTSDMISNNIKTFEMAGVIKENEGSPIASATTTDLSTATGNTVHITGTTTITSFGIAKAGTIMNIIFDGILTLTYNATSLHLPGNTNIITAVGDSAIFESKGGGNWHCISYQKDSGGAIVSGTDINGLTENTILNADDYFIVYDSINATNRKIKGKNAIDFKYGDGSDGNVTITTTVTLTRDMYYNNLIVNSPGVLDPNGFKIYVKGTISGNGTIRRNGNNGTTGVYADNTGVGAVALNQGSLNADLGGANGRNNSTPGNAGTASNPSYTTINGATGGNGYSGAGGVGGTATRGALYNIFYSSGWLSNILNPASFVLSATQYKGPAGSGGGGGYIGGGGSCGGGGGGNGGVIWICAKVFNFTGTMESKGGNGGGGQNSSCGGGGGGNGGVIYLIGTTFTSIGTQTLTGGTLGSPNYSGGQAGNAGVTIQITV